MWEEVPVLHQLEMSVMFGLPSLTLQLASEHGSGSIATEVWFAGPPEALSSILPPPNILVSMLVLRTMNIRLFSTLLDAGHCSNHCQPLKGGLPPVCVPAWKVWACQTVLRMLN